ncbi:sugar ABC transporter ATP-binding protein [Luteitalea sp. TBR-22]|uniref:sugar ABC transporter ATP-binding protein n=1 Tax=Luteitalea sp. TBR-22 TaxID=2802971 RepID=UPI001AF1326B|nr:sugar ABC transporter ATP-binding protein [Luteitalea sp. TBR-22]BCS34328.1 sugar ABC transporter ATP-binding protein [Luteitalea sp. TBR-22]
MLSLTDIKKHFGATRALDGVTLQVRPGRVHALVGENGAGKSTLMNVIAGGLRADDGSMTIGGAAYRPAGPLEARQAGIALIHQELSLCDHLTVAENILLGREPRRAGRYDRAAARVEAARVLAPFHHPELHPDRGVADLPIAARQVVEICRAVSADAKVVLMDEPTSSLPREDVERLFDLIRRLRASGVAVVYISHFLEEVRAIADDLTVLRDGRTVWTGTVDALSDTQIISHMVGRDVAELFPTRRVPVGDTVRLEAEDVRVEGRVRQASLRVRAGEILGIAGLVGAGRTELLRGLMGLEDRPVHGRLAVDGRDVPVARKAPWERLAAGLGYLSEDRKGEGLTLPMSIADNMTCTRYGAISRRGILDGPAQRREGDRWIDVLKVKARTSAQAVRTLSGGNQQKVAVGRLLHQQATVWLLDEPTRGVDVGSKVQLYEAIARAADQGCAVVMVSSYLPELFGLCDSLAVMSRGTLTPARPLAEWTPESVMAAAIGTAQ